ncbi:DNA-binding protein [Xanthomonas campestris pv. campestris]|uniref:DNA-binding protein n=1 Tax=Xanthomonas campestris TaxID=339 RepID=UPI001E4D387A|nr:DNA-binding protein [Xanthomonas campestris]MCD0253919.1 DNA-binding protein [Xanthomonas campestris pv. campestris]MEB1901013.1 DNA-binding protein [Xanthomonas campestris pv. campestris]WVL69019.1 DNA-binding protein [Xanthomonas campestris pv. campestris]
MARTSTTKTLNTTPPKTVANAAARGLRLREQHRRGGTAIGVARARDLSAQKQLSAQTIRRMHAYFARHSVDKTGKGWADRTKPSAGYIAWLLWGGDAGQRWAEQLHARLQAGDNKQTGAATQKAASTKSSAKKNAAKTDASAATSNSGARTAAKKRATPRKGTAKKATSRRATQQSSVRKSATKKVVTKKTTSNKTAAKKPASKKTAPWKKPNPAKASRPLSAAQKTQAKARAKAAGRPYPNLVDNMAVAKQSKARKAAE